MSEINNEKSVIFYVRDSPKSCPGFHPVSFCYWPTCGVYMLAEPSSGLCDCAMHLSTSEILYGDKRRQLCEIQFTWSDVAQQERNAYFFKLTEIKELSRSFRRENLLRPWAPVSRWTAGLPCGCRLSGVMLLKFGWQWVHGFNRVTMYFVRRLTLETARCNIVIIASLWNSTDISAVLPQMGLSNFRAIGNI